MVQLTPLLKDRVRQSVRPPWAPSAGVAFRVLIFVRLVGALYASVSADCDEVYNYWEPLHFLLYGHGFQTWEYAPAYTIRSWAYILLHAFPAKLATLFMQHDKLIAFYAVRIIFALASSAIESMLYRAVAKHINIRLARYFLIFLVFSTGMWNSSTAFLPSSFSLHLTNLAYVFAMLPPQASNSNRTFRSVACFGVSALFGWPFAALLGIPFALEELLIAKHDGTIAGDSLMVRFSTLAYSTAGVAITILFPMILVDSLFYNKLVIAPWNIVSYNILSASGGPDLYGTEPWHYYIMNGLLNFNIAFLLALASGPILILTRIFAYKQLGGKAKVGETSNFALLAFRLAPFYLWFAVLTSQAHKEERFMFPSHGLLCFNAATSLYLTRGWVERIYLNFIKHHAKGSASYLFTIYARVIITLFILLSVSRIAALHHYYRAPTALMTPLRRLPLASPSTLCYADEWYRFPSHFMLPDGMRAQFLKSEFDGILPKNFDKRREGDFVWDVTGRHRGQFNDRNQEEPDQYVEASKCDYLISTKDKLEIPAQEIARHAMLDPSRSPLLTRTLYIPIQAWTRINRYTDLCLYQL